MRERARYAEVLLAAIRTAVDGEPNQLAPLLREGELGDLPRLAEYHGLAPAVYRVMQAVPEADESVLEALAARYHAAVRTHLRALEGLRFLHTVIDPIGPWLVVKGPVLASMLYPRADLRGYTDLDVVVASNRFAEVVDALEAAGCELADRNWTMVRALMPGELRVLLPSGIWLDLHWHLLNRPQLRSEFTIDVNGLIESSRPTTLDGVTVRTLSPAATVVHLALHACLSGADRLVWAVDIRQALRVDAPDWRDVAAEARAMRVSIPIATMMRRASKALPLDVKESALRELTNEGLQWRGVTWAANTVSPLERASGRPSFARIVARAARGDARTSRAELRRRSRQWLRGGMRRDPIELDHDERSPGSILFAAGGTTDRAAYMAAVGAADRFGRAPDSTARTRPT